MDDLTRILSLLQEASVLVRGAQNEVGDPPIYLERAAILSRLASAGLDEIRTRLLYGSGVEVHRLG